MSHVPSLAEIAEATAKNADKRAARRGFLRNVGVAGVAGIGALGINHSSAPNAAAQALTDAQIFNFALNFEYLGAEFYLRATTGAGLPDADTTGTGTRGAVTGGRAVPFVTEAVRQYIVEFAADEVGHVRFLRQALGSAAIARPAIDFTSSFTAAARAAGVIGSDQTFDPFATENGFLLAAFIFEDVCVTALKGAAPLLTNKTNLENAAGFLAVEGYQAAVLRSTLLVRGLAPAANLISDARDRLDGSSRDSNGNLVPDTDQGVTSGTNNQANITPLDANAIAFSRTPGQVLNIAYLNPRAVTQGGFFPQGVNGTIRESANNA